MFRLINNKSDDNREALVVRRIIIFMCNLVYPGKLILIIYKESRNAVSKASFAFPLSATYNIKLRLTCFHYFVCTRLSQSLFKHPDFTHFGYLTNKCSH